MRYAYFPGCKIPYHLPQYGLATRAVCRELDIELVDVEFNCCGYPVRHNSLEASMFSAARNLALAAQQGLEIMTPCKCCFGNLRHCIHWMGRSEDLRRVVGDLLRREGLAWPESPRPVHLLTALDRDVGAEAIRTKATRPLHGVKVAAHYGCHALRPGYVTGFDNPLSPTLFERLVEALGAEPVDWPMRLECCGNPLWGKNDAMAAKLARKKLVDAASSGADVLCTACTYCQMQFDSLRDELPRYAPTDPLIQEAPPSILYAQMLGLALGLEPAELGLEQNATDWAGAVRTAT
jgi:heterodisulfide reductase subunit B